MVGNIIEPLNVGSGGGGSVDPDDYFDPVTHTATEANFIAFLEAGGKYDDTSLIGYKVVLSNTSAYNNGVRIIADINHDSANTGQTNCYDLIAENVIKPKIAYGNDNLWRNSTIRTWLNSTFYSGFSSNFKNKLINIKYNSENTWYTDDKIIIPSYIELNGNVPTSYSGYIVEGVKYPVFESGSSSRIKILSGTSDASNWWTRSRDTKGNNYIWYAMSDGTIGSTVYYYTLAFAPMLRIS